MTDWMNVKYLNRHLGTASGWDGDPGEMLWFYDFKPAEGVSLPPSKELVIDEGNGYISSNFSQDGEPMEPKFDIPAFLAAIPRIKP